MKKFAISFLIYLCLAFNIVGLLPVFAEDNTFKQGIYRLSDFNSSKSNNFTVVNPSPATGMFLIILDKNVNALQAIRLIPNSAKFDLMPIMPEYKILIIGKGKLHIFPKQS